MTSTKGIETKVQICVNALYTSVKCTNVKWTNVKYTNHYTTVTKLDGVEVELIKLTTSIQMKKCFRLIEPVLKC